jgi:hypothetical protein
MHAGKFNRDKGVGNGLGFGVSKERSGEVICRYCCGKESETLVGGKTIPTTPPTKRLERRKLCAPIKP